MADLKNTQQPTPYNVLLIGDDCVDIYQYGTVDRISPEAPVPVFKFSHEEQRQGMAGNVRANLETLGCNVTYLHGNTSSKTRLIDLRSKQHIVRVDNDVESTPITFATEIPTIYDAIVISDYNKGTVSYELIEQLRQEFAGPIFVDTKKTDLARLEGCIVKINSLENSLIKTTCTDLIVTMGKDGAVYKGITYSADAVEVADVCGAGDTFLAALVSEYLTQRSIEAAIPYAVRAAGVTVQHLGVYAPTLKELE
jgi:D-beta-D-heptose 7-phosphate kinase/D-beta-D-heptose 1-phosphate adenosyltransferase